MIALKIYFVNTFFLRRQKQLKIFIRYLLTFVEIFDNILSMDKLCKVNNCDGKTWALGYCHKHYERHRRHGSVYTCIRQWTNIKGKEHPAYKNGTGLYDYRNTMKSIELLGENCQLCNSDKHVHLHHKDNNPKNNETTNWQRLCASCHRLIHSKYFGLSNEEKEKLQKIIKDKHSRLWKEKKKIKRIEGHIFPNEVCKILNISKQRLHVIKDRLEYIVTGKKMKQYKLSCILSYNKKKRLDKIS